MMALLAAMVARRVSCSTLPLWRPLSLGPLTHSPFAGASSRALFVSAHSTAPHADIPLTLASSSGARSQPQSIASRSSTHQFLLAGDSNILFPFFQRGRSRQADAPLLPTVQEILQSHISEPLLIFLPTHRWRASLSTRVRIAVPLRLFVAPCSLPTTCCALCRLNIHQAPLSPFSAHSPLPRVHDWSTVVAACHHSLSAWHQSVLAHVSGPLPDFPERASVLDSLFDSFTRILCGCASHHSRRRPGSRPRTRQPLWWNDACYHALVARNGSWRDFPPLWVS